MKHFDNFLENVTTQLRLVDEILVCKTDGEPGFQKEWQVNGVKCTMFSYPTDFFWSRRDNQDYEMGTLGKFGHSLGMKAAIDRSKNETVLASDNDLFYYIPADKLYLDLMQAHDLSFIGVSSACALFMSYQYFPCIISMLIRKRDLPGRDWMAGRFRPAKLYPFVADEGTDYNDPSFPPDLVLDGEYLCAGVLDREKFPNPTGSFDTGCHLYLWAKERNLNWASFQADDVHLYMTKWYKTNKPLLKLKVPNKRLLWHSTGGGWSDKYWEDYQTAYENYRESLENEVA
jgi:hypothetical protein